MPFGLIDDIDVKDRGWWEWEWESQMPFGLIDDIDCTTFSPFIQAYFKGIFG